MKFAQLKYNKKVYKSKKEIDQILEDLKFYWLVDSELEDADIEIEKNTLIWNSGDFFSGNWEYGIFKEGYFKGNWINGIWEGGVYAGNPNFEQIKAIKGN